MDRIGNQADRQEPATPGVDGPTSSSWVEPEAPPPPRPSGRARAASDLERRLIFNYCNVVLHARAGVPEPAALQARAQPRPESRLTPRMRETMTFLLQGHSEKQIALRLRISRHTVHVYIKQIYRRYNVNSRGELFADWVRRGGPLARHS